MDLQFRLLTLAMAQTLRSINEAIRAFIAETIGSLTQVIEDRLSSFAKRFSEETSATIEQAVK